MSTVCLRRVLHPIVLNSKYSPSDDLMYIGFTPLHIAAARGYKALVEVLLQYGANASIPSSEGSLAVELSDNSDIQAILMNDRTQRSDNSINSLQHQFQELQLKFENFKAPITSHSIVPENEVRRLEQGVLEAARSTARSMKASDSEYLMMQKLVKCCSIETESSLTTLKKLISAEPELALYRTYGFGVTAPDGFSLLHVAAAFNNCKAIDYLLKNSQLKAWTLDLQGRTALHVAAVRLSILMHSLFRKQ